MGIVDTAPLLQKLQTGQSLTPKQQTILMAHGLAFKQAHTGPLRLTPIGRERASEGTLF
jgi:hypothetical protein